MTDFEPGQHVRHEGEQGVFRILEVTDHLSCWGPVVRTRNGDLRTPRSKFRAFRPEDCRIAKRHA